MQRQYSVKATENFTNYQSVRPRLNDDTLYKLHISLAYQDFIAHKEALIEILVKHLEAGAIDSFKVSESVKMQERTKDKRKFLNSLKDYQSRVNAGEEVSEDEKKHWRHQLANSYGRERTRSQIDAMLKQMEFELENADRFLDSSQFTIYVPDGAAKRKVASLCKDITNYLQENQVGPGKMYDVQSPLSPNLSLRQEYLMDDYNDPSRSGVFDRRINTIPTNDEPIELERRKKVVVEQKNSPLFDYLEKSLSKKDDSRNSRKENTNDGEIAQPNSVELVRLDNDEEEFLSRKNDRGIKSSDSNAPSVTSHSYIDVESEIDYEIRRLSADHVSDPNFYLKLCSEIKRIRSEPVSGNSEIDQLRFSKVVALKELQLRLLEDSENITAVINLWKQKKPVLSDTGTNYDLICKPRGVGVKSIFNFLSPTSKNLIDEYLEKHPMPRSKR